MGLKRFILAFLAYGVLILQAYTYETDPRVRFENYSISDGLSHLGVSSFYHDSKGFLWIGTYDGLNRFDGINYKVYKHNPDNPNSLLNNRVRCILEHSTGKLLIGTEVGLSVYNPELELFEELKIGGFKDQVTVMKLFEDSNNRLWILTNKDAVHVLDFKTGNQKNLIFNSNNLVDKVVFHDIVEDDNGYIWLASTNGLICYQKDFKQFTLENLPFLEARKLRTIELDNNNNLWLAFKSTVLGLSLTYSGDTIEVDSFQTFNIESIVTSILSDSKGNIWASSTNEGVFRLIGANNFRTVENYMFDPLLPGSISSNWISEIYEDEFGTIWFGTAEKGIDKYSYNEIAFLNIDQSAGLIDNYILELCQFDEERLIIGTRRGISVFNFAEEHIEDVWFDDSDLRDKNAQVSAIFKDKNEYLWIGISGGLYYLLPGSKHPEPLENLPIQLSSMYIASVIEDDDENLWVGTTSGVFRISFDKKPVVSNFLDFNSRTDNLLDNKKVSVLYLDPKDGSLWMGTWYNGLYHIAINGNEKNVDDFEIKHYHYKSGNSKSLRSNFISVILRAKNGELWIGTEGGGLSILPHNNDDLGFIHYSEDHGLSSNVVKTVLEDDLGRLFLGTNYKLNVLYPQNKEITYFGINDGLKSEFFTTAAIKLSTNEMVFGSNMGITFFDPAETGNNNVTPSPEFGDFLLSYKKVHPGEAIDGDILLKKSLSYSKRIHLKYFQNTFSIELLGVGFDHPEDSYYRYRLNNFDQDWIYTNPINNMASYTNVPPGEYLFEFNVSNTRNEWSGVPKQMLIKVTPPFWKTWVAYIIYTILLISLIVTVFKILLNIERLRNNIKLGELEKDKEKEVNDIKLKFFTNISHEFKTPVSLILGPVESLVKECKNNEKLKYNLLIIHEQANYLLRLVNQLLEFRKVEKESIKLKCVEDDIISFIRKIIKSFNPRFYEKNIQYSLLCNVEEISVWFDPSKIEMIIYNLLSNAYKFTPKGGAVVVRIEKQAKNVVIEVEDNGAGVPIEEQSKIFDRFYQSTSSSHFQGTGIGLTLSRSLARIHHGDLTVSSEQGKGTVFTLSLPLGMEHFNKDELVQLESEKLEDLVLLSDEYPISQENSEGIEKKKNEIRNLPSLLIVEDNYRLREYLINVLSEHYNVLSAGDGNEGFSLALSHVPEIIVSDVMMPVMDGIQLVKKLKNEILTSHIPIILLTVKNEIDSYIEGLEIGAEDFISKPFHIEHLLARLKNIIENRARLRSRYSQDFNDNTDCLDQSFSIKDTEFINTLYEIAEENLDNTDFSSDEFSKAVYMSRTNFYKKLRALTDQTPGEFMRLYRVKRANDLLSTGEHSVSQVVHMIGFKSRSHFYQCFKSIYGKLPGEMFNTKM